MKNYYLQLAIPGTSPIKISADSDVHAVYYATKYLAEENEPGLLLTNEKGEVVFDFEGREVLNQLIHS